MVLQDPADAAALLAKGGLVAYPTDTLWGLAVDPTDPAAVARLRDATGSPRDKPFSVAAAEPTDLVPLAIVDTRTWRVADLALPGPVTLILDRRDRLPADVAGQRDTIGVRVPDHPTARALARKAGPITSTSANPHGEPPARTLGEVEETLGHVVDGILAGPDPPLGEPSTVVDLTGDRIDVLREGAWPTDRLEAIP